MALIGQSLVSTSSLILVTPTTAIGYAPQPNPILQYASPSLLNTFAFHYEGEQAVEFNSDITDHYTESNSAIQDQVSLKPIEVTTHGFIGDLNDVVPGVLQTFASQAQNVLENISAYNPGLTISTLNSYNEAFAAYQEAQSLVTAAYNKFSSNGLTNGLNVLPPGLEISTQASAFAKFYNWWTQRTLFTIQTPWNVLQNMAILTLRAYQDETTRTVTDFQLTFKQMNFVTVQSLNATTINSANTTGRAQAQSSSATNLGTNVLTPSPTPFSPQAEP